MDLLLISFKDQPEWKMIFFSSKTRTLMLWVNVRVYLLQKNKKIKKIFLFLIE